MPTRWHVHKVFAGVAAMACRYLVQEGPVQLCVGCDPQRPPGRTERKGLCGTDRHTVCDFFRFRRAMGRPLALEDYLAFRRQRGEDLREDDEPVAPTTH